MTTPKNQNSILVLATLGVYLGLILAGATPQVLAQAALAKEFSVKDEIEVKDDLDNKPDGCNQAELRAKVDYLKATYLWYNDKTVHEYSHAIKLLLDEYSDVAAFDVSWSPASDARPSRLVTTSVDLIGGIKSPHELDDDIIILGNGAPGKTFSFTATKGASAHTFRFESNAFPYDGPLVRYLYGTALDFHRCTCGLESRATILRHTEIKVHGNNLILATHLPRGSLDPLLANDAK